MDLHTFVRVVRTRWRIVAAVVVICLLGAAAATVIPPKRYQASSKIFVSVSDASTVTDRFNATQAAALRLSSYAQIAAGAEVAGRAVDQLGIDMSPDAVVSETKVDYTPESLVFSLTVTDTDPNRAADLVNAMSDQFAQIVGTLDVPPGSDAPPAAMRATVVEHATPPDSASSPNAKRNMALGLLVGLLLGIVLALVRDATDRMVRTVTALDDASGRPLVGELPRVAPADEGAVLFGRDDKSSEAYRGLRSRLLHLTATVDNPVVLVTGPAGREGATTVAVNLALSLAEINATVLLVEGDLRRSEIGGLLDVEVDAGLSDVLRQPSVIEGAIVPTDHKDLSVLTSGSGDDRPAELLGSAPLDSIVDKVKSRFDYVVIDGPPVLPAADAVLLATRSDGALLVVRNGKSRSDDVRRAVDMLEGAGAPIIGSVFTNAKVG